MPIPLPLLDDRQFTDLIDEGRRLIPGFAPSWTDHNASDPGITFIELFAFIAEMLMYRADRVSEDSKRAFLRLLAGPEWTQTKSLDDEIREVVSALRVEQRAVTPADFVRLSKNVAGVNRAHCLPRRNVESDDIDAANTDAPAHVSVVIVADENVNPVDSVTKYLKPRCLLTTRLHVTAASYLTVAVNLKVYVFADQDEKVIAQRIKDGLAELFDARARGPNSPGWAFGKSVYVSDLYSFLDGMEGIDYVVPHETQPVLKAWLNDTQASERDIIVAGKLVGLRLKPNELANFNPNLADSDAKFSHVVVVRQTVLIPEE